MNQPDKNTQQPPAPQCPHCGTEWNTAEIAQKECFTCGHPDPWDAIGNDDVDD